MRVWGVGTSRTIRVHWALCELGLEYETREIIPRTESMMDPGFSCRTTWREQANETPIERQSR